ncbi:MAG: alpha/beta fold hydrolase [Burkholderiales bacterium]
MKRRDFMRNAAMTAAGVTINTGQKADNRPVQKGEAGRSKIYYEVHGNRAGKPLFLAFPMMASYGEIFGAGQAATLSGFLDRLTDRYRVLVVDYPNIGKSHTPPAAEMTADRVCTDLLSVTSEAGFDRFAYWGYSWGGGVGILLASRSKRVSALVCGGWTPLGGQHALALRAARVNVANPSPSSMLVLRDKSQYAQWITFHSSLQDWPEAQAVASIKCPKLVFAGADSAPVTGGVAIPYAEMIRERRKELEAMG